MKEIVLWNNNASLTPEAALDSFGELAKVYTSLQQIKESNITERERIRSEEKRVLKQIKATKEILLTYLNRSFDERAYVFKKNFQAVDTAIQNNNMEALATTIQSINMLAAQSPFKDIIDVAKVKNTLLSNEEIDV